MRNKFRSFPYYWTNRLRNRWLRGFLFLISLSSVSVVITLLISLVTEASLFFMEASWIEFLTEETWTPLFENARFGIWPLLSASFSITALAVALAFPLSIILSAFFSDYATASIRQWLKPLFEVLAAIPTIILGFIGVFFLTPFLQLWLPVTAFNKLSASLMMAVLLIPYLTTLIEEILRKAPQEWREASMALGASRMETLWHILIPGQKSAIIAALLLGIARALGETMIVTIVAGSQAQLSFNPLTGGQTLTAYIAAVSLGDSPHGSMAYQSMYAVGLVLLLMSLSLNLLGFHLKNKG